MAITHAPTIRTGLAQYIKTQVGAGGKIRLKTAGAAVIADGTVTFADAANGEAPVGSTPINFTFSGTGDAATFDVTTSTNVVVYSGVVGQDITVSPVGGVTGQAGVLSSYKYEAAD